MAGALHEGEGEPQGGPDFYLVQRQEDGAPAANDTAADKRAHETAAAGSATPTEFSTATVNRAERSSATAATAATAPAAAEQPDVLPSSRTHQQE